MTEVSTRRSTLLDVSRALTALDQQLDTSGALERQDAMADLVDASDALARSADHFASAAAHGLGAGFNLALAAGNGVKGTVHAAAGTGLLAAAGAVRAEEESADVIGRASQLLGRALIGAGNRTRDAADIGGAQLAVRDVAGDPAAPLWSAALLDASSEQFEESARAYLYGLSHLAGAVANGVLGTGELVDATRETAAAAAETLAAAKDLGDAAAIEVAERAVELSSVAVNVVDTAVPYGEEGVDAAGVALQSAGRALVVAGNAVNTARGTDTRVH